MSSARAVAAAVLITLVAAPFLLVGLGAAAFDDPGEGMHAEIARELWLSRDLLDLRLSGVQYVDKPPLLYALLSGTFALAGPSEAAARVVPALAALAAVSATAWLGARLLGAGGGLVAGLALLTSLGFFAYGRYVRPETLFVAALAWGFALVLVGLGEGRRAMVGAGLVSFGLAGMAKDPLGALAPPLVIGLTLALGGCARPFGRWLPPAGVGGLLALGFGWWALVERRAPGFAWYTVVDNHILNVMQARRFPDEDVSLAALEFLTVAAFGAAPWALTAGAAVVGLIRRRAWRQPAELPWVALAVWVVGVIGLTSLSAFRLPHYGLPAYPAIALLAARGWQTLNPRLLVTVHAVGFAALALVLALAWAGGGVAFAERVLGATDIATRKAQTAVVAGALPLWPALRPLVGATAAVLAAGALASAVLTRGRRSIAVGVVAITMLAVLPLVARALALVADQRAVRVLAVEVARRAAPDDLVAHEGPLENSGAFEWYAGRRPLIVDGRRSVLGFGATRPGAAERFWDRAQLGEAWAGERRIWLITTRGDQGSVTAALSPARLVAIGGGRRLYVNE